MNLATNLFVVQIHMALWEHHSHLLAKEAGVNAAVTMVINSGEKYHALLSRRFDRTEEGRRIHFASAMTLLGLTDGCDAQSEISKREIDMFRHVYEKNKLFL